MSQVSPPPEQKDNDDLVATLNVSIIVSGASLAIFLRHWVLPSVEVAIDSVDISASVRVDVDPTQEVIRIAFLKKPKIKTTLKAKCVIHIPESLVNREWIIDQIARYISNKYTVDNPKKISLSFKS